MISFVNSAITTAHKNEMHTEWLQWLGFNTDVSHTTWTSSVPYCHGYVVVCVSWQPVNSVWHGLNTTWRSGRICPRGAGNVQDW